MCVQLNAPTSPAQGPGMPPSRVPSGVKKERMFLILAVLSKHTDMKPYLNDIHLNVTGGRLADCGRRWWWGMREFPAQERVGFSVCMHRFLLYQP